MTETVEVIKKAVRSIEKSVKMPFFQLQQAYFNSAGSKFECNVCNHKANEFKSDSWHLYCNCPYCLSDIRQRLLLASLQLLDKFSFENIIKDKKVLHFAPEKQIGKIIENAARKYETADFLTEGYHYDKIDHNIDISDMKDIKDATFDCVIACDVLEHVPNHLGGIKEVYRVLSEGGYCIFTIPQKDNLKTTFEDLSITDKKERERIFGQVDHLRIYGDDFADMVQDAGFEVSVVDEKWFDKNIVNRHVLFPSVLSKHPLATNYRKIFFGKKTRKHVEKVESQIEIG